MKLTGVTWLYSVAKCTTCFGGGSLHVTLAGGRWKAGASAAPLAEEVGNCAMCPVCVPRVLPPPWPTTSALARSRSFPGPATHMTVPDGLRATGHRYPMAALALPSLLQSWTCFLLDLDLFPPCQIMQFTFSFSFLWEISS